ncbi:hypothetical protein RFI_00542 [Reticulomyxa filosa]|uniref:RRM domain-containing protein n=1 Tax=Reticulomyxa filosa TaxID=46433 RepID=X6PEQ2_RETFI|nr:hypothetical protein RFI_00542 [Reticulomyxa filosa]|eukprot:ETO36519.1 hypothetical protein RFI_00542 [Reticulomyxa filosa]
MPSDPMFLMEKKSSEKGKGNTLNEVSEGNEEMTKDEGEKETINGSKTMEEWLQQESLIVHPVWIGNLPAHTNVKSLRDFIESKIGQVLVSLHVSDNGSNSNDRKYAFLNLPFAEKQMLAATLLDGQIFNDENSKFPQSFFGSSPINAYFKQFRDNVAPQIFSNPALLNLQSVRQSLKDNNISIEHLPNRMWCVHCTLAPHCHRSYCSFYHKPHEKELGRILSLLAAEHYESKHSAAPLNGVDYQGTNTRGMHSHHTLLVQGLPKHITSNKIQKWFEVFGDIDHISVQTNLTYLRMKRAQDATKIVHLLKGNNAKILISFAPHGSQGESQPQIQSSDEYSTKNKDEDVMDSSSMHKKPFRTNKKRKYHKTETMNGEWNINGGDVGTSKVNSNVTLTSNIKANVNSLPNLNIVALSNSTIKSMPISMPFQTISPITAIPSGQSIAFPWQLIPTQVFPVLSNASPTYIYSDHTTPIQTTHPTSNYMFTQTTPSYCFTPPENSQFISTPNFIHGLHSPLSPFDVVNTPLTAIPMATPLLTGLTTRNINTNTAANSNYIHTPILNMQRELSPKKLNEQQPLFPKLPFISMTDTPLTPMEQLLLPGNTSHD